MIRIFSLTLVVGLDSLHWHTCYVIAFTTTIRKQSDD